MRLAAIVAVTVALGFGEASGQTTLRPQVLEIDVKPLLVPIPDFSNGGQQLGIVQEAPPEPTPEPPTFGDAERQGLLQWLRGAMNLDGEAFDKHLRLNGETLRVEGSPELVRNAKGLLDAAIEARTRMITVEARMLGCRWEDVAAADERLYHQLRALSAPDARVPAVAVEKSAMNGLIRATQAGETSTTFAAPRITLFNGQRAYVVVATGGPAPAGADVPEGTGWWVGVRLEVHTVNIDPNQASLVELGFEHVYYADVPPSDNSTTQPAAWPPKLIRLHRELTAAVPPEGYLVTTFEGEEDPAQVHLLVVAAHPHGPKSARPQ